MYCFFFIFKKNVLSSKNVFHPELNLVPSPAWDDQPSPSAAFSVSLGLTELNLGQQQKRWWADNMHFIRSSFHKSTSYLQPFAFGIQTKKATTFTRMTTNLMCVAILAMMKVLIETSST